MRELNWNEVQTLRGLIFKALDEDPDQYTRKDLISSLEKLGERSIELKIEMEKSEK